MAGKSCILALFFVASISTVFAKDYLTGKMVHVDSALGTELRTYVLYILYEDITYSVVLNEKPDYKLEWAVNDPIEFRPAKDAIYLRRPNGKVLKFPLLKPSQEGTPSRETRTSSTPLVPDFPFPPARSRPQTSATTPAEPPASRVPRCAELAARAPQFEFLANACEFALSPRNLPNFICQETVRRATSESQPAVWKDVDVVTAEVTFVNGRGDRYSNLAINGKSIDIPPEIHDGLALDKYLTRMHTGGLWSLAAFGTELAAIFNPRSQTRFKFDGEAALPSGPSMVFDFHFDSENNYSYKLSSGAIWFDPGLAGSLWINQDGSKLLRLETYATEIDSRFPFSSSVTATNYGDVSISGVGSFLLPTAAQDVICGRDAGCSKNVISFHDCRKFGVQVHLLPNIGDDH